AWAPRSDLDLRQGQIVVGTDLVHALSEPVVPYGNVLDLKCGVLQSGPSPRGCRERLCVVRIFWRVREPAHILIRSHAALWRGASLQIQADVLVARTFPPSRGV